MDRRDEWLSPESIEEQIERHLQASDQSPVDARMLHDLQHLAEEDARRLVQIRERLVGYAVDTHEEHPPLPLRHQQERQPGAPYARKQTQFLVRLMSALVAVLIIASMLGVFTRLKPHAAPTHFDPKTTAPTPLISHNGTSAFLLDATSGKVLVDISGHTRRPIAGVGKIMTAVVAIENANLNQYVTIDQTALDEVPRGASTAQLQVGDRIQLRELLYGLLLPSGDDAASVIAHAVGGNTQRFVVMMNEEAHQLHLSDTYFSSPYSSAALDEYSSATDLTSLASYAMQLSDFSHVAAQQKHALASTPDNHAYLWQATNTLLATYPGMNGITVAYNTRAGVGMVFSAQRNNRLLIGAELYAPSEKALASDVKKLLDRGFGR